MRKIRKILTAALISISAIAALTLTSYAETIQREINVDFQGCEDGIIDNVDIQNAKDGWQRIGMQYASKGEWRIVDGFLGKEPGDKSMKISADETSGEQALQFFPTADMATLKYGNKITISFDFATSDPTSGLQYVCYRGNGNSDTIWMLRNSADGIRIINKTYPETFTPEVWYNFKAEFIPGASSTEMYGYINGELFTTANIKNLTAGKFQWFYFAQNSTDPSAWFCVDNIKYTIEYELPPDYYAPEPEVQLSAQTLTEAETERITVIPNVYDEVSKVEIYADGELQKTFNKEPYVWENEFPVGEHEIYAVVTDGYGKTGQSTAVTLKVLPDTRPRLTCSLEDGASYDRTRLDRVSVNIKMSEASIENAYINADGEKLADIKELNGEYDLSGISIGIHDIYVYVENNLGEYSEQSFRITALKRFETVAFESDYENSNNLSYTDNGIGYVRFKTIDEAYGNSIVLGADKEVDVSKEGAWTSLNLKNCATTAIVDVDMYVSAARGTIFAMYSTSSNRRTNIFKVSSSKISTFDGTQSYPFSAGEWHHIQMVIDAEASEYTMYVDDEAALKNVKIDVPAGSSMSWIRIISQLPGVPETYFALDNQKVMHVSYAPYIQKITSPSDSGDNRVSVKDNTFTAYFSAALSGVSVYPSKFSLYTDGKTIPIEKTEYDSENKSVVFTVGETLEPGKKYRLTVGENVILPSGDAYGETLYGDFYAVNSAYEVVSQNMSQSGSLTCNIKSFKENPQQVYLLVNIYDSSDKIISREIKQLTLNYGENQIMQQITGCNAENKAEVFIWDSLSEPTCIMLCEK